MKILGSEITPFKTYINRRQFIKSSIATSLIGSLTSSLYANHENSSEKYNEQLNENDSLNNYEEITTYNNYYEFGTSKTDPSTHSNKFQPRPWSINIEGMVNKPGLINLEDIISNFTPSLNLEIDKKRKTGSIGKTKKILIYPEQGIGDEVFYAGFLKSFIKKYPYELVIACNERLKPIFKRSFINNKIIGVSEIASLGPTIDFEMPIGSLIEYIKFEEDNNFPQKQFLYAENDKIKKWEKIFNKLSRKPKIGISWSGGLHLNNKIRRSFPLEELMQYMPLKFDYISLQYGACENEIKTTEDKLGHKIYYWKDVDPLVSLEEQFAQISALDCVVSAQNSTLHFSGALGINSIALLPISPDYRWRNDGNSSLFYKTINCIRQSDYNSWDKVFDLQDNESAKCYIEDMS